MARAFEPGEVALRAHSTIVITPELLAALAQVEARGNPVARTYWRWRLTWHPFELYQPASSAVGMYQMTDATFREAKHYCIRDHVVSESCWLNSLYTRVLPSHAIELAAAPLDRGVSTTMEQQRISRATLQQKQDLAAIIHLCGAGPGEGYARRGFRLAAGQKCGDHDVKSYLTQVNAMKRQFLTLAGRQNCTFGCKVSKASRYGLTTSLQKGCVSLAILSVASARSAYRAPSSISCWAPSGCEPTR